VTLRAVFCWVLAFWLAILVLGLELLAQ